jgi:thioredoxin 1
MPVVVDLTRCPCATPCYPAKVCPPKVLHFDLSQPTKAATLNPALCGDCKGICTNFCDPSALRFASTLAEVRLLEAELLGTLTAEEINAERKRLKEEIAQQQQKLIVDVTMANFEQEVLQTKLPVVVDLWAPSCAPCKTFTPIFAQVAQEYAGKVKFCKINTDAEKGIAQALRVQSIPTLLFFAGGQLLANIPGAIGLAQFRSTIEKVLQAIAAGAATVPNPPGGPPKPPRRF